MEQKNQLFYHCNPSQARFFLSFFFFNPKNPFQSFIEKHQRITGSSFSKKLWAPVRPVLWSFASPWSFRRRICIRVAKLFFARYQKPLSSHQEFQLYNFNENYSPYEMQRKSKWRLKVLNRLTTWANFKLIKSSVDGIKIDRKLMKFLLMTLLELVSL